MAIKFKTNIKDFNKALENKNSRFGKASRRAIVQGMRFFEGKIIAEQMTGRPGLKTQTGQLRNSWQVKTEEKGAVGFSVSLGTSVIYARIHQFGGVIKPKIKEFLVFKIAGKLIMTKRVTIPKRLRILEDFEKSGKQIIRRELVDAARKEFKR